MKQYDWNFLKIKSHGYIFVSVLLWGLSQFMMDQLLLFFSPTLLIFLRFFLSGLILIGVFNQEKKFHYIYIITGGLGSFGYYKLIAFLLRFILRKNQISLAGLIQP
ncbi:MAG: hypothetical protein ACERKZ_18320 [Lachnotalea sp.]